MSKYTLLVKLNKSMPDDILQLYKSVNKNPEDSGFDLYCPYNISASVLKTSEINFEIKCAMINNNMESSNLVVEPYYLYARSSISKYPLLMCNSVGIIDKGYRGDIRARVFCMPHDPIQYQGNQVICNSKKFNIAKGMRLFQICAKDLSPFDVKFVDQLPDSIRGEGGFGSTGN